MMNREVPVQFRHEFKHYISLTDCVCIRQRLNAIARHDRHAGESGSYKIRSLYFETHDDKALREKLNGVNNREKFRIRYYNADTGTVKLEKKTKINGIGSKLAAPITRAECELLLSGETGWMKSSKEALILELHAKMQYQQLKPKTIVDYIREPYIYAPGNVRVTIDSQIETGIHSKDFFNPALPTIRTNLQNIIILEVKYDAFLPDVIKDAVQLGNRKSTAYSKYAVCRMYG